MYYTYVLRSNKTGRLYTGHTKNVKRRLLEHDSGQSATTRKRGPFQLVHLEKFPAKSQAYRRELFLKTGKGRKELRRLMGS